MKTKKLVEFFEEYEFRVHLDKQDGVQTADIETWTSGGVNMIHCLNPFTVAEFERMVEDFDVDEEIDRHREMKGYKEAFSIRGSLADFEKYKALLEEMLAELKKLKGGSKKK